MVAPAAGLIPIENDPYRRSAPINYRTAQCSFDHPSRPRRQGLAGRRFFLRNQRPERGLAAVFLF